MSQITTHILDTAEGKPAQGINIVLEQKAGDKWMKLGEGITNADGRISDLLNKTAVLKKGIYRMLFNVSPYFEAKKINTFYTVVTIEFKVIDSLHYHIPLLISPYGYSTYRGS